MDTSPSSTCFLLPGITSFCFESGAGCDSGWLLLYYVPVKGSKSVTTAVILVDRKGKGAC